METIDDIQKKLEIIRNENRSLTLENMHLKAEIHFLQGKSELQNQVNQRLENELKESSSIQLNEYESNAKQKSLQRKQKNKILQKDFRTLINTNQSLEHEILVLKSDLSHFRKLKKTISII